MTEIEKLAGLIDPRVKRGVMNVAFQQWPDPHDLIAASDALRQHATALEIGRGIGREEAAKEVDSWATTFGSQRIAAAIRAASPVLDVEGMVERIAKAIERTWCSSDADVERAWSEPDSNVAHNRRIEARAVIVSLGIKNG